MQHLKGNTRKKSIGMRNVLFGGKMCLQRSMKPLLLRSFTKRMVFVIVSFQRITNMEIETLHSESHVMCMMRAIPFVHVEYKMNRIAETWLLKRSEYQHS